MAKLNPQTPGRDPEVYTFKPLDMTKYFLSMQPRRADAGELKIGSVKKGTQGYIRDTGK